MIRAIRAALILGALLAITAPRADAATQAPARGLHGMVASQSALASQVGVDVMAKGGNAVDAAVAVAFVLAVTFPEAGNIGGGGFMLLRLADGRAIAIDYRETAPAAASRTMFINPDGTAIQDDGGPRYGYRAAAVPGTVAGLELAWRKYGSGKLRWRELLEPARRIAAKGFVVDVGLAQRLREEQNVLARYAESRRIFLRGDAPYREGEIFRQPELAATLARLARGGADEFYRGETARRLVADIQANRGLITHEDLANYRPKEREPLLGSYRGYTVMTMPPPSSGGAVVLSILNMLEGYDLAAMGWNSAQGLHLTIESMRRAFADRAELMGDTDFVFVPVAGLIDKRYAAARRATIDPERASRSVDVRAGAPGGPEPNDTTHFSIVDAQGNVVSNTYTLNDAFGSHVTVAGTGMLLNDEMDDFSAVPGQANQFGLVQGTNNEIGPHRRPLSSMAPTIVLNKDGRLWFAIGARGGPRIISTVVQSIVNVIDHGMDIQAAIDAPRVHQQWLPDEVQWEQWGLSIDTRRLLEAKGHIFASKAGVVTRANAVMIDAETGIRLGAVDGRGAGAAVGY
jgi:gamma-glutamyltranspeptidase/glutathione hydrolase